MYIRSANAMMILIHSLAHYWMIIRIDISNEHFGRYRFPSHQKHSTWWPLPYFLLITMSAWQSSAPFLLKTVKISCFSVDWYPLPPLPHGIMSRTYLLNFLCFLSVGMFWIKSNLVGELCTWNIFFGDWIFSLFGCNSGLLWLNFVRFRATLGKHWNV